MIEQPMIERFTTSDGIALAYYRWGEQHPGPTVLLHHGFASSAATNWVGVGIVDALVGAGRQVLAVDARGHGESDKPHDPAFYGEARMSQDLSELLAHLQLVQVDLFGYSMGAVVALITASTTRCVRRLVIGGVGEGVIESGGVDMRNVSREDITQALLADDVRAVTHTRAAAFRTFADSMGADLKALAAQAQVLHSNPIHLAAISAPTLVLAGEDDVLAVKPQRLAAEIPDARCQTFPGDHLTAISHPGLAAAAIDFLRH